MPFEGINRIEEPKKTPFDRMAEERHKKATEEALDAEVIDEADDELETLNLENIEHLQAFMEAAEDAYMDAMRWEWKAYHENYQNLTFDDIEGREVFEVLRDILDEIRDIIDAVQNTNPPEGGYTAEHTVPISHDQVSHLQELYDKVLLFRDTIEHAYASTEVSTVKEEVLDAEPTEVQDEPIGQGETIDGYAEEVTEGQSEDKSTPESSGQSQAESAEITPESLLEELKNIIEPVHQDQFITEIERETVRALELQFGRQIEAGEAEKAKQTLNNLRSIIESQTVNVNPDLIDERTKRILERVEAAKTSNPDVYMTATTLAENIDRIRAETKDETRVVNAYQNLERHALEHEDDWLTVCGMAVPRVGPDGVYGARSFREGLMLSLDRHPALIASPQRKMMTGKIISMLRAVPETGLSEEQVTEIKRLARIIDAPKRLIEARQSGPANNSPFDIPKPLEEAIISPKRGDIKIESTDSVQPIEIRVAEGAEEFIAHPEAEAETEEGELEREQESGPTKVRTVQGVIVPIGGVAEGEVVRHSRAGLIALSDTWGNEYPSTEHKRALEEMIQILQSAPKDMLSSEQTTRLRELAEVLAQEIPQESMSGEVGLPIVTSKDVESDDTHGYVSKLEEDDPVNVVESDIVPQIVPESFVAPEAGDSLTRSYLTDSRYTSFIEQNYGTPEKFEKFLRTEIARIDENDTDTFEKWLGESHASAFGMLEGKSIDQVRTLSSLPGTELREVLKKENIKYESFVTWMDVINDLMQYAGANPDMRIGELVARGMIEVEMTYYEDGTTTGQFTL